MAKYETNAGDTFDGIAYKELGNELLSSEIIKLNPQYSNVVIFAEGVSLEMPELSSTATTLAPWEVES